MAEVMTSVDEAYSVSVVEGAITDVLVVSRSVSGSELGKI